MGATAQSSQPQQVTSLPVSSVVDKKHCLLERFILGAWVLFLL